MSSDTRQIDGQIAVITLFSALWPIPIAVLPIATLTAIPRPSDARLCDVFVSWVPADDGTDAPADASGWRSRVQAALSNARDLGELVSWLTEGANSITRDLSVEILSIEDLDPRTESTRPDSPAPLATCLDAQALGVLGDHACLLAEVEGLALASA